MSKLNYEIADRYANELGDIKDKFDKLERGRIYEFTRSKMDGSLEKNMKQLRMMIEDLLQKIQNDEPGNNERIVAAMRKMFGE